ncbi:MAG TPA: alpha-galactosidase [Spirochaetia bacterium]|nr:alpha-galactosidase [Spirochaetales bacterium]HRY79826.1 alpha-galactosidase [Spirochaetia bacterium]
MTPTRFVRTLRSERFADLDCAVLEYRSRDGSTDVEPRMTLLEELPLIELVRLADGPAGGRPTAGPGNPAGDAAFDLRGAFVFANGWQSWSPGWELAPGERMERARFVGRLNVFTDHPGLVPRRGEVLASFLGYLRSGGEYLALASLPEGGPPLSFLFRRREGTVSLLAYAEGHRFRAGDLAARILVVRARSWFALKDVLREAYAPYDLFSRLAFLGAPGEPLVPGGYESWYNHYADIDEGLILADLRNLAGNGNLIDRLYIRPGKPTVFQVDDGWERTVGDWRVNEARFPRGMKDLAGRIEEAGFIPGLWLAPFLVTRFAPLYREKPEWLLRDERGRPVAAGWIPAWGHDFYCLDLSIPEVLDYLTGIFDRAVNEWGYRYLKLDFLYAGMLRGSRRNGDPAWIHYRKALERLTSIRNRRNGKPVAYLGCGAPFEASFEFLPLMRIGADTREDWDWAQARFLRHPGRPSAWISMKDTIGRALWDGTVFLNDPDVVFCRTRRMRLSETEKELVALTARIFASQVMFSDDTADFEPATEGAFTERIAELYGRISGREFRPERVPGFRDVYTARSRDGRSAAVLNLSDSDAVVPGSWPADKAVLARFRSEGGRTVFAPRSISLFDGLEEA